MRDPRNELLTWCEIDLEAMAHNLGVLRARARPGTRILLVVKSNAYGHGLSLISRHAEALGADALGVHSLEEAQEVRGAGWRGTVLVMGYVARSRLEEATDSGVEHTVFDHATIQGLDEIGQKRGRPIDCHLKLETGTQRQGIPEEELPAYLEQFRKSRGVRLAGLSTHFANIEDTTDHTYARGQLERFRRMADQVQEAGFAEVVRHAACTAAILAMPETSFDLARVGIGAYGIWPSRETLASSRGGNGFEMDLKPVLSWKARIAQVKWVPAGSFVGYGCSHRTGRRTRLAVLPVGYADGYARHLSGLAHVLIAGRRAPVLGRICMNMILVEVTDLDKVDPEDIAVLIGRGDGDEVSAAQLASQAQTIPYEIVSRVHPQIPRLAVNAAGALIDPPVARPTPAS